jgi:hypothetical protein
MRFDDLVESEQGARHRHGQVARSSRPGQVLGGLVLRLDREVVAPQ